MVGRPRVDQLSYNRPKAVGCQMLSRNQVAFLRWIKTVENMNACCAQTTEVSRIGGVCIVQAMFGWAPSSRQNCSVEPSPPGRRTCSVCWNVEQKEMHCCKIKRGIMRPRYFPIMAMQSSSRFVTILVGGAAIPETGGNCSRRKSEACGLIESRNKQHTLPEDDGRTLTCPPLVV